MSDLSRVLLIKIKGNKAVLIRQDGRIDRVEPWENSQIAEHPHFVQVGRHLWINQYYVNYYHKNSINLTPITVKS